MRPCISGGVRSSAGAKGCLAPGPADQTAGPDLHGAERTQTRPWLLPVHIDHPLLLVLVAELAFLLALPVECWSCAASRLCTLPVLHVDHTFLRSKQLTFLSQHS